MQFLAVVTLSSIYHGSPTRKMFWEEKFILVNMRNFGLHNVWKHKGINIGDQYIALAISLELGFLEKSKVTSSGPRDYVERFGKGLTTSLNLSTRWRPKNKQKESTSTTDVDIQNFSEISEEFNDVPYPGYRRKKSKNQPTEDFNFPLKVF